MLFFAKLCWDASKILHHRQAHSEKVCLFMTFGIPHHPSPPIAVLAGWLRFLACWMRWLARWLTAGWLAAGSLADWLAVRTNKI